MVSRVPFKTSEYITVYQRDGGRCGICREPVAPEDVSIDHIYPLSRGGVHDADNWQLAHRRCNARKHARLPGQPVLLPRQAAEWVANEEEPSWWVRLAERPTTYDHEPLLSVSTAAARLGVTNAQMHRWIGDKWRKVKVVYGRPNGSAPKTPFVPLSEIERLAGLPKNYIPKGQHKAKVNPSSAD